MWMASWNCAYFTQILFHPCDKAFTVGENLLRLLFGVLFVFIVREFALFSRLDENIFVFLLDPLVADEVFAESRFNSRLLRANQVHSQQDSGSQGEYCVVRPE